MRKIAFRLSGHIGILCIAVCSAVVSKAQIGLLDRNAARAQVTDLGELKAQAGAEPISVTVALKMSAPSDAENLLQSLYTPGDPLYHQFLTADQFVARFAPKDDDVAKVVTELGRYGLTAERASSSTLKVTGMPADLERAFAVSLHSYMTAGGDKVEGRTYHAPLSSPTVPADISESVAAVVGLDSRPRFQPKIRQAPQAVAGARLKAPSASKTHNAPGLWTVEDFAKYYNVRPLYNRGISGRGRTIGILTLASFTPSDAYGYWDALGLKVSHKRIKIVDIDGGPGKPSDDSGSIETTLDVEQSGGIAPGAKIIVYQAPNTNQGFLDLFAAAVESNKAETLSISWGNWEWFNNRENAPVPDPFSGQTTGVAVAVHELLIRAAIQGQSAFTASGDDGAYEANGDLGCYGPFSSSDLRSCSLILSVDYPASHSAITAVGGTTLPGLQEYCLTGKCTPPLYDVKIEHEQVWGWDYLAGLCEIFGLDPIACGTFPGGSGGGVSFLFRRPRYQSNLRGVQRTQPDQVFELGGDFTGDGSVLEFDLPERYRGRNVPDVSFNADPNTGYIVSYTSDLAGFEIVTYLGGTSFGAPELNGVAALLGEYLHGRIGLLNFPLYQLARSGKAYRGSHPPLNAIPHGDNWFYRGRNGYSPAVGLGTLDVANFARALRGKF